MSREFKFRAFIKWLNIILEVQAIDFNKKIVYCKNKKGNPNPCDFYKFDDVVLMQDTGLKDKNRVEIYEGDVIQIYRHCDMSNKYKKQKRSKFTTIGVGHYQRCGDENDIREVVFEYGALLLYGKDGSTGAKTHFSNLSRPGQAIEVIGNIYENPDLLEQK